MGVLERQIRKLCNRCEVEKPESDFYRDEHGRLRAACKKCWNAGTRKSRAKRAAQHKVYQRNWRQANNDRIRSERLVRLYGITLDQFNAMLGTQDGRCAVCLDPMKEVHVDHCHETKVVRGLLCGSCNRGLGQFKDEPERLRAALRYLDHHGRS